MDRIAETCFKVYYCLPLVRSRLCLAVRQVPPFTYVSPSRQSYEAQLPSLTHASELASKLHIGRYKTETADQFPLGSPTLARPSLFRVLRVHKVRTDDTQPVLLRPLPDAHPLPVVTPVLPVFGLGQVE